MSKSVLQNTRWTTWSLPILLLLAVWVRSGTFELSVINHDESTYILIGKALWQGDTYLVDAYDTKPAGIFLIYALLYALSGGSIWLMRLYTALVIGMTAWLLFRLSWKASGQIIIAWAAALSYILLTSTFKYYGLSPNTELFFTPFAVAAILLVWRHPQPWWIYAIAGILLGFGFVIKYVIAADALAIGLLLLWRAARDGDWWSTIFKRCIPLTVSFFIPFGILWAFYAKSGHLDNFLFYTFEVTSRYPVKAGFARMSLFTLEFFGRFFPFTILAILACREPRKEDQHWQRFLLLWLVCTVAMTIAPGKRFGHYHIQVMPPLVLLAATFFSSKRQLVNKLRFAFREPKSIGTLLFLGLLVLVLPISLQWYYRKNPDFPRVIAEKVAPLLGPDDYIYTGNYHHIVYHLLDKKPPTPYIHSTLLYYETHVEALEINLEQEANRILNPVDPPAVVLLRTDYPDNALTSAILNRYQIRDTLPDELLLLTPAK